ncbi:MAG: hypothetical protein JXA42_26505 [Anaerolineales bacterium]|nr:hypothetical protein [Anaerolineales bacterium]
MTGRNKVQTGLGSIPQKEPVWTHIHERLQQSSSASFLLQAGGAAQSDFAEITVSLENPTFSNAGIAE